MQNLTSTGTSSPKNLSHPGEEGQTLVFSVTFQQPYSLHFLTGEQVVFLINAVMGPDKPLRIRQRWSGAYWFLRWFCNYPPDLTEFCAKINALPGAASFSVPCCSNNMRRQTTLEFMDRDPRGVNPETVSKAYRKDYACCRHVAFAMWEEMLRMGW